jgi:hypothetical protein
MRTERLIRVTLSEREAWALVLLLRNINPASLENRDAAARIDWQTIGEFSRDLFDTLERDA